MHAFKKTVAALAIAGLLAAPAAASAQTASTSSIQTLLSQIATLQAQIKAAQQQQAVLTGELLVTLKQGNRGENVRLLQQLLAQDPSVYPEGTVSGFYGRLTASAVKRFQKKHGIEQAGNVGPKTLRKLNELFGKWEDKKNDDHGRDDDDDGDDDKWEHGSTTPGTGKVMICHKGKETIYVGARAVQAHMRHGDILGACSGGTGTTTPDTTAPIISVVSTSGLTTTSATIIWTTNENSTSQVEFGTTTAYGMTSSLNASLVAAHSVALTGLVPNTLYNFRVWSKDAANNAATSSNMTFTTAALDTIAPTLSSIVSGSVGSTTALISWNSNEAATGKVYYGTANPLVLGSASTMGTTTLSTAHSFALSGLMASTTYYFVVESADAANNAATSSQQAFTSIN